jgi:hypothetical protein
LLYYTYKNLLVNIPERCSKSAGFFSLEFQDKERRTFWGAAVLRSILMGLSSTLARSNILGFYAVTGSLREYGCLELNDSLAFHGFLERFGSFVLVGFLIVTDSLKSGGLFAFYGSLCRYGFFNANGRKHWNNNKIY